MPAFTRRLHILIDDARYADLARESRLTGRSIGELIRASVDTVYGVVDRTDRRRALDALLAEDPMPVDDWEQTLWAAQSVRIVSPDRAFDDVDSLERLDPRGAAAEL